MERPELKEIKINNTISYYIEPVYEGDDQGTDYNRALRVLDTFIREGRPTMVCIPDHRLCKEEITKVRNYYCKHAKEIQRNCIYFTVPVVVKALE